MKIIHIESGLGNQMLSYCEYLALKKMNPDDDFYLETIIYDIPECNDIICQWNGYELERIFGIKTPPNIKTLFSPNEWEAVISDIRETLFWEHNWNWPATFSSVFNSHGLSIKNGRKDFTNGHQWAIDIDKNKSLKDYIRDYGWYKWLKMKKDYKTRKKKALYFNNINIHFRKTDENILDGQRLSFKWKGSGIEKIEKEVREAFTFPKIRDSKNQETMKQILSENAVAIHARRGDIAAMGGALGEEYFLKAIELMTERVNNPSFFCFSEDTNWLRKALAPAEKEYEFTFMDYRSSLKGLEDFELMRKCQHQIIANSTYSWWAAYLNNNVNKVVIYPYTKKEYYWPKQWIAL